MAVFFLIWPQRIFDSLLRGGVEQNLAVSVDARDVRMMQPDLHKGGIAPARGRYADIQLLRALGQRAAAKAGTQKRIDPGDLLFRHVVKHLQRAIRVAAERAEDCCHVHAAASAGVRNGNAHHVFDHVARTDKRKMFRKRAEDVPRLCRSVSHGDRLGAALRRDEFRTENAPVFFDNGKPTGKCSSCNSRRRTKKESGSD